MNPLDAHQNALAAEHAAVHAYGVVGAHASGRARAAAEAALNAHRNRRDQLRELILEKGAEPVAALPDYRLPFRVASHRAALRLAVLVEERVLAAYLELVAVDNPATRKRASMIMQDCMARLYGWRERQRPADREPIAALPGMR